MLPRRAGVRAKRPGEQSLSREARDEELARAGWTKRFTCAPPRLGEVTELYEALGCEVLLDALVPAELPDGCDECVLAQSLFQVVYTRRPRVDGSRTGGAE